MAEASVRDKIIMVTGAAAGFGRHCAYTLAADGAHLVLTDRDAEGVKTVAEECRAKGVRVLDAEHDVAEAAAWQRVIAQVEAEFGKLDALVNNAGFMLTKPFLQTSLEEYQQVQRVNVDSIWIGVQTAYPLLEKAAKASNGGASVANISSVFGQVAGFAQAAYCASKGAVRLLTKCQATEFARAGTGIRVNSVHPGPGNTQLAANGIKEMLEGGLAESEEQAMQFISSMIPVGRFAEAEDVADLVRFLCSDASRYMTGAELTLDGGYTAV
ncbi:SDR family oxidoreductase [Algiphilus sp.]|uniref:SDR family NAD(P)-dependent oxidoreductase n=1 Tax=Algiphilus sp. TaxID=1872431 RepID=UPI0025C444E0|nr:SDR family oxidoreductase [Algiphilus sp.]MCK5771151.1 SDR family oxidoreductase [Algiphilus sp.]